MKNLISRLLPVAFAMMLLFAGHERAVAASSAMKQLAEAFASASPVTTACLSGTWVEIESVWREQYAADGAEHRLFNPKGLRRTIVDNAEERRIWDWRLVIERKRSRWLVRSAPYWSLPTTTTLVVTPAKELLLDTQFDGDTQQYYRCRCGADRLICLLRDHESGNGVVFRRAPRPRK